MLERPNKKAANVRGVNAGKRVAAGAIGTRDGRPLVSVFIIDGTDCLQQVLIIELAGNRLVRSKRRCDVLIVGKRVEAAVPRTGDRVIERSRLLVNQIAVITDE